MEGKTRNNVKNYSQDINKYSSQEREQYYKFYLDSAQRAIEMMRKQHKSVAEIKIKEEEISTKLDHHEEENLVFAENPNPIQIETNYEEFNKSGFIEDLQREKTKTGMNQ